MTRQTMFFVVTFESGRQTVMRSTLTTYKRAPKSAGPDVTAGPYETESWALMQPDGTFKAVTEIPEPFTASLIR